MGQFELDNLKAAFVYKSSTNITVYVISAHLAQNRVLLIKSTYTCFYMVARLDIDLLLLAAQA